jgi:hypothetical protein
MFNILKLVPELSYPTLGLFLQVVAGRRGDNRSGRRLENLNLIDVAKQLLNIFKKYLKSFKNPPFI